VKTFSFFILSSLLVLSRLYAADENVTVVKPIEPKPNEVVEDSSEHHRIGKKVNLNAQLVGVGPNAAAPSAGITGGYFLNRNQLIQLEVLGNDNSNTGIDYKVKTQSVGVHFKSFVGNSFYYKIGLDERFVDYNYSSTNSSDHTNDIIRKFKGQSLAASVAIGNQWQWDNFTLGCDWFGYVFPLAYSTSDEQFTAPSSMDFERSYLQQDKELYTSKSVAQGLRFYLGVSF